MTVKSYNSLGHTSHCTCYGIRCFCGYVHAYNWITVL